jgi:hypothetical protein
MSRPKTKRYTVTIVAVVEVPWDLIVSKNATRKALRDPASHFIEVIERQFDDAARVVGGLKVRIAEVL